MSFSLPSSLGRSVTAVFPPAIVDSRYEVGRILLAKNVQRFIESRLLDLTVCGQVFAGRVAGDEVLFGEEALSSRIVSGGEVDLGKPECVFVVVCNGVISWRA